LLHLWL